MSVSTPRAPLSIDALRDAVRGRVITADDTDYDAVREMVAAFTTHDLRPSSGPSMRPTSRQSSRSRAIPASSWPSEAVVTALPVTARADGGVVIDVRDLDGLDIDVAGRTAWAGSGLTAGAYTTAAAEHGWPPGSAIPARSGWAGSPSAAASAISCARTG